MIELAITFLIFFFIGIYLIFIQLHNIVIELRWANRMKEKELNIYQDKK